MKRTLVALTLSLSALALAPQTAAAQTAQDSADIAWKAGNIADAERRYARLLAADSTDGAALHRMGLMHAWAERYNESLVLFDRLMRVEPRNREARLDRARVLAWRGDTKASVAAIDSMIAEDPSNVDAMHVRAQFLSWAGNYDDALRGYDRILEISPESRTTRMERAKVLAWSENFSAATAAYNAMLKRDPNDREALLGLGNVLSLIEQHDSARAIFARMLASNADDLDALRGLARAATWQGKLVEGERTWQRALALAPQNVDVLVGYAQTLRWQGRDAAALDLVDRARIGSPGRADVIEQVRWISLAMSPRVNPAITYEADSDENRITTSSLTGAFRPLRRLELRADAYQRHAAVEGSPDVTRNARGVTLGAWLQIEPGWAASVAAGGSTSDEPDAPTIGALRAALMTPGRFATGATLSASRAALDGSAALVTRQVRTTELSLDVQSVLSGFSLAGSLGAARYHSRVSGEDNSRTSVLAAVTRPVARGLVMGLRARTFSFEKDLNDGYFDPDFYGVAELTGRYLRETRHWLLSLEAAPGMQQVRSDGDPSASYRASTRIGYILKPGRTVGFNATWAKSGLQQISPSAGSDYAYRAIGISAGWAF